MEIYLYLTEPDWVEPWVNGGEVPIKLASSYLSDARAGIMTPDENLIHESPVPIPSLKNFGIHIEQVKNFTFTNNTYNGVKLPDIHNGSYYTEDGLILSFCHHFHEETAERLEKRACVKINDISKLRKKLDKQLGCKGLMKKCEYTKDHRRNHFLKSVEDEWQDEFRIFWRVQKEKNLRIPAGTAQVVWVHEQNQ